MPQYSIGSRRFAVEQEDLGPALPFVADLDEQLAKALEIDRLGHVEYRVATKIRTQLSRSTRPIGPTVSAQCALSSSGVPFVCSLVHEGVS